MVSPSPTHWGLWSRSWTEPQSNKKLSYCCDSRSYCMQEYNKLKQLLRVFYFNPNTGAAIRAKRGTDRAERS